MLDVVVDLDSHLSGQIPDVSGETSDGNADVLVDLEEKADLDDRLRRESHSQQRNLMRGDKRRELCFDFGYVDGLIFQVG
ncbi:hypothetical protein L2E82_11314 [Cichorium intybus]|uniref:Uncharacterized protein n=1 Tax=Cichorium intybus TaxID=13427 RepID=A0ACB9GD08_CICIN|nr:hypothetical protein L2E82_11314 [Cichorium intybus]